MTRIIGLSGGIGSGKSTVSRALAALGATVIDADAIVHELQTAGSPMLAEIAAAFGPGVLDAQGRLDRAALGAIVFRDAEARQRLGAIVHPPVGAEIARRLARARSQGVPVVVLDIPLLFEGRKQGREAAAERAASEARGKAEPSGAPERPAERRAGPREAGTGSGGMLEFDATIVVWAPEQAQIERQIARDGCSREEALRRVRAQLPLQEKKALADFVIDNSGTPEETEQQVRALWEKLSRGPERAEAP
jgi:dephospho-CoA kinase